MEKGHLKFKVNANNKSISPLHGYWETTSKPYSKCNLASVMPSLTKVTRKCNVVNMENLPNFSLEAMWCFKEGEQRVSSK